MTTQTNSPAPAKTELAKHAPQHTPVVRKASAIEVLASRMNVEPVKLFESLAATCFKGATNEEMLALVVVANQYGLNPFLRQIYAFPNKKSGGIVPVVGIDGWSKIVNDQENFNGCEFLYEDDDTGVPISCTCIMHIRNRDHPVKVTEYYAECYRKTEPWDMMPHRMLRHKTYSQCGRLAFGLGGIYDEDEARDIAAGVITASGGDNVRTALPGSTDNERLEAAKRAEAARQQKNTQKPKEPQAPQQAQQEAPQNDPDAPATWDELLEQFGITHISEQDGIAVQNAKGETLRPEGQWADYSGWTVPDGLRPESDRLARIMAEKASRPAQQAPAGPVAQDPPGAQEPPAQQAPASGRPKKN